MYDIELAPKWTNFMVKSPFDISKAVNEKSKGSKIGMKCKNVLIGDVESC